MKNRDVTDRERYGRNPRFRVFDRANDFGIYNIGGALVATVIKNRTNACELANDIAQFLHDKGMRF